MLKRRDIENFLLKVPPRPTMDTLKVHSLFELLRTEPRTVGELSERLEWTWPNTKRFLTETKLYKDVFIYDDDTKEFSLSEDRIQQVLIGHDPANGRAQLQLVRDELADGHKFDHVPQDWFTDKIPMYPYLRHDFSDTSVYRWVHGNRNYDPFFTMCYIFSGGRKFRGQVERKLEGKTFALTADKRVQDCTILDVMTWGWAWSAVKQNNWPFFIRDFSYLPDEWNRDPKEEYGLVDSVEFICNWLTNGPLSMREGH